MASKSIDKPKSTVWLTYRESTSGGQAIDPDDGWTDYEDEHVDFSLRHCYSTAEKVPDWLREQVDVDFKVKVGAEVDVVVVRYTTGGTFGRTLGYWYIEGIYPKGKQAEKVSKSIYNGTYEGYKPWVGYFESLEQVEIETLTVL